MQPYGEILTMLKQGLGEWVSGEAISGSMNVSRTTVWKEIKKLQSAGYKVEASTKKGYRLAALPDLLSPEEVCRGLETEVFGRVNYLYLPEVDSTNNYAKKLAAQDYPEGTVVVAEKQNEGRGRRGRQWYSPEGEGLYLSIILRPRIPLKDLSRLSVVVAGAVADTLEKELQLATSIKWPNDILIGNRKVAGILTEAVTDMDGIEYLVVGIGININSRLEAFPADFRTPATSLSQECGRPCSRVRLLHRLLYSLESDYRQAIKGDVAEILDRVRTRSVVIGQEVRLDNISGVLVGKAVAIDQNGFLCVRDEKGFVHTVMSGEIMVTGD